MLDDLCPDCEYYPPRIVSSEIVQEGKVVICRECRDCGYYWEEFDNSPDFF